MLVGEEGTLDLQLTNLSAVPARLSMYCRNHTVFSIVDSTFPAWIPPETMVTLRVKFRPDVEGELFDTLRIWSRLAGADRIDVPLHGIAPSIPLAPDSLTVQRSGTFDVTLYWSPVTHSVSGRPITPDYYIIYGALDHSGPFAPVGASETTSFLHSSVLFVQGKYYYQVVAHVGTGRGVEPLPMFAPLAPALQAASQRQAR